MTKQEMFDLLFRYADKEKLRKENNISLKEFGEVCSQIEIGFEILDELKPRIHLKDNTIKEAHFVINDEGLPIIVDGYKDVEVAFIEASGFVFKTGTEYNILKDWLENEKED